jgi:hypothetical protein
VNVHAARSDPPTPRSQAAGCAAQQREWDRVALMKERIRRQERLRHTTRSTSCASSRVSRPHRRWRTHPQTRRRVTGKGPPLIGRKPGRPRPQGSRGRPWNQPSRRARSRLPPDHQWRCRRAPRRCPLVRWRRPRTFEGKEARLLELEVSSILFTRLRFRDVASRPLLFFCCQGVAGRPRPCARQGT